MGKANWMNKLHRYGKTGDYVTDTVNGHYYVIARGGIGWNLHKDGDYCFADGYAETLTDARYDAYKMLEEGN